MINWKFEKINISLSTLCLSFIQGLDILKGLLEQDPHKRLSIREALKHPWTLQFQDNDEMECTDEFENTNQSAS